MSGRSCLEQPKERTPELKFIKARISTMEDLALALPGAHSRGSSTIEGKSNVSRVWFVEGRSVVSDLSEPLHLRVKLTVCRRPQRFSLLPCCHGSLDWPAMPHRPVVRCSLFRRRSSMVRESGNKRAGIHCRVMKGILLSTSCA